jgi:segregation and condensation protein A
MQLELAESLPALGTEPWLVHTAVFDGPLDLLLYLVKRDGIDLVHLPVAHIAEAYLAYLGRMRELNLAIAGDYLVMAATLIHLKSLELLPRRPTLVDEVEVDPREELQRKLEAYKRVREAADQLDELPRVGREVHVRSPLDADGPDRPLESSLDAFGLLDLLYDLIRRRDAPEPTVVLAEGGPDVEGCSRRLLAALRAGGGRGELTSVLRQLVSRAERVVTFISCLEMVRLGWLDVRQDVHLAEVWIEQRVSDEGIDMALLTGNFVAGEDEDAEQMSLPLVGPEGEA